MLRIYVAKRGIGAFEREGGQRATLRPDDFQRLGTAMAAASVATSCRAMPPSAMPIFLESPRISAKPDVHTSNADRQCLHKRIARSAGSQLVPYMSGLTIALVCCGIVLVAMVLERNENDLD